VLKVAQFLLALSPSLVSISFALQLTIQGVLRGSHVLSSGQVYWRFISGFCPSRSSQGRFEQIGHFMHIVQSRINTGNCASR